MWIYVLAYFLSFAERHRAITGEIIRCLRCALTCSGEEQARFARRVRWRGGEGYVRNSN